MTFFNPLTFFANHPELFDCLKIIKADAKRKEFEIIQNGGDLVDVARHIAHDFQNQVVFGDLVLWSIDRSDKLPIYNLLNDLTELRLSPEKQSVEAFKYYYGHVEFDEAFKIYSKLPNLKKISYHSYWSEFIFD